MNEFRVLLINCNTMLDTLITAGIGILSASLKDTGCDVKLFDTTFYRTAEISGDEARTSALQVKPTNFSDLGIEPNEGDVVDEFVEMVASYKPHLIGLSSIEVTHPLGVQLLNAVRDSGIPTIVGGPYATFAPEIVIRAPGVDMVCVGEGERPLVELCKRLRGGEDITSIGNLWVKQDGKIIKNPVRAPIPLSELPRQDWSVYDRRRFMKPMGGKISVTGTFEMNRGCPYTCTFCINSGLEEIYGDLGGYYREQDVDRLIDEMVEKKEAYNLVYVYLVAESFLTTTRERIRRFGKLYQEKVGLPFWVEARPESITEEKVELLMETGCEGISIGVESGNVGLRKNVLGRNVNDRTILKAFELLRKSGIRISANNIIGFPTETREMIFDTIHLDRELDPDGVMVSFFSPYKGATLRRMCEDLGYIEDDEIAGDYRIGPTMDMPQMSAKELVGIHRTFPLYVKFPESEWKHIRLAEQDTPEGNAAFREYSDRYSEMFMN
ncbi:MAG: B12-binding domain-containing radical SAM protein [Alphaproteobacteria bacterium]|jgi:anaerobic magnesium-protoporphyrin IX monomethyl ester cyclase|nr:B12-binding domain-containing radical SAM protein [Alphaproteobacteria bacterium]MBT7943733.1 B12-binding domain-containing radical SAM protein [Alphaproteobacteria bacterium]